MQVKALAIAAVFLASLGAASPGFAGACEQLRELKLYGSVIAGAKTVPAGPFETAPPVPGLPKLHFDLPSYCRVTGAIHPTSDSDIKFEVWLPVSAWNGRYQQVGNGGLAGSIVYDGLANALVRGSAAASTDDGHSSAMPFEAEWAVGHPEKLEDYGDRAVHLTAKIGEALVRAYYGKPASHTYFIGCSDGGRESLMEAQRYPEDFDGYLVGAPGIDILNGAISDINVVRALRALPADQQLGPAQLKVLSSKVLEQCDALDGVKDGVLRDPRECKFDPEEIVCKPGQNFECLTPAQAGAVKKIYEGPKDAKAGEPAAYGFSGTLGSEQFTWPNILVGGLNGFSLANAISPAVATLLYGRSDIDIMAMDLAEVARDANARVAPVMNPQNPDLSKARALGKKILMFHGWADANIPAQYSIDYFDAVAKRMGRDLGDFYRFFMVPGMPHCSGAPGLGANMIALGAPDLPSSTAAEHDWVSALERWVEQGKAPDRMIATEFDLPTTAGPFAPVLPATPVKSMRPVCVYPKRAFYKGGPQNDAVSFNCE